MDEAPMPSAPSGRSGYGGDRSYGSGGAYGGSGFKGTGLVTIFFESKSDPGLQTVVAIPCENNYHCPRSLRIQYI